MLRAVSAPRTRWWLLGRPGSSQRPGGDALQIRETAAAVAAAGYAPQLRWRARDVRPGSGDVVHLFNVLRCPDWGDLPQRARGAGARVVVTPLFHRLDDYHRRGRWGLDAVAARLIPDPYAFAGLRWGRDLRASARRGLAEADRILLAHADEAAAIEGALGLRLDPRRCRVVPVPIPAPQPVAPAPSPFGRDFALCVGRVEPLKAPLIAAEAARRVGVPLAFVGAGPGQRHPVHSARFRATLRSPRLRWLGPLGAPEVQALMASARVHMLASWTEVLGRVSLEAASRGAAVVATDVGWGPAALGRDTPGLFLAPPGDVRALARALDAAWRRGRVPDGPLVTSALGSTWERVAPVLLAAVEP